jgi:hypothetical protein
VPSLAVAAGGVLDCRSLYVYACERLRGGMGKI